MTKCFKNKSNYGDYKGLNVGFLASDHLFSVLQVLLEFFLSRKTNTGGN